MTLFYYKRVVAVAHSFKFTGFFSEQDLQQADIIVTNSDTSFILCMHILKDSLLFNDTNCNQPIFLWYCYYFTGALEMIRYVKGTVFL